MERMEDYIEGDHKIRGREVENGRRRELKREN